MNGESLRQKLLVTNPQGFHLRPMTAFAETASKFQSRVVVSKNGKDEEVNGKSAWDLMLLAAEQGSELTLDVSGPDAQAAFQSLLQLLVHWSIVEHQQHSPPLPQKGVS